MAGINFSGASNHELLYGWSLLAGFRGGCGGKILIRLCLSVALVPSVNWYEITHMKAPAYTLSKQQNKRDACDRP